MSYCVATLDEQVDLPSAPQESSSGQTDLSRITALFGGPRVLKASPSTALDVHKLIKSGLPQKALEHLVVKVHFVSGSRNFENAFGMTYRTYQRRKEPGDQPLSLEQSSRTWTFAQVLAKATDVFGSQDAAERWISEPAMGLDRQTPLELLQTPAGIELVNAFLLRLDYGVYT